MSLVSLEHSSEYQAMTIYRHLPARLLALSRVSLFNFSWSNHQVLYLYATSQLMEWNGMEQFVLGVDSPYNVFNNTNAR